MHMQDGIGRGGYRVLAFVFFGLGAFGLAMAAVALAPSAFFDWTGLVLAGVALATLTGLILATLGPMAFAPRAARPSPAGAPDGDGGVVPLPTPEPPADIDPDADLGFEYPSDGTPTGHAPQEQPGLGGLYHHEPAQPLPPLPAVSAPAVRSSRPSGPPPPLARPAHHSAPPSGKADPGAGGWPERRGKAGVTRRQVAERAQPPSESGTQIEFERPAGAPAPRREAPIIMARTVASAEATGIPEGTGVGKCGNCGVLLLAPKKRPIRLQCPRCERVHTLA
jgi:hypothetical protein